MKLGLYGGSFDPVHLGHLLVAQAACEEFGLDRLCFIPAAQSPFKPGTDPAPAKARLQMLRLALAGQARYEVDTQEVTRGGVSYTIDTVRDYRRRFSDAQLFWLIGADHVAWSSDFPHLEATWPDGADVFLADIWPTLQEVRDAMQSALKPEVFRKLYKDFAAQNPKWNEIPSSTGNVYEWDRQSTYIQEPPFFENFSLTPGSIKPITGARALGIFGDSVTTDHISPAGAIKKASPAGRFLTENGVTQADFNSYGSRRGNDLVMTRGTFANVRIKNLMLPAREDGSREEGGYTLLQLDGENKGHKLPIYDAAMAYQAAGVPTVLFLEPPQPADLARFADMRCVGLAGQSRGQSPAWMREQLRARPAGCAGKQKLCVQRCDALRLRGGQK